MKERKENIKEQIPLQSARGTAIAWNVAMDSHLLAYDPHFSIDTIFVDE